MALQIRKQDATCTSETGLLVTCQSQAEKAFLHVEGYISNDGDISGHISLTLPTKIRNFNLQTYLESSGPHDLNGATTVVTLDRMVAEATADVSLLKKDLTLKWNPFFHTRANGPGSHCKQF